MTLLQLLKKMYLIKEIIYVSYDTRSDVYSYLEDYQYKQSILAFSSYLRGMLTIHPRVLDSRQRMTTRFALYLEALAELYQGRLLLMRDFLEAHNDVTEFLSRNFSMLEKLYYAWKGKGGDVILLEEFSLLLDEDYTVIEIDLEQNTCKFNNVAVKKEQFQGFFQKINDKKDPFFGNTAKEREEYIHTMSTFYSSFYI